MKELFSFIEMYVVQISAVASASVFIFTVFKFLAERQATHFWKEFDAYHKLVKELVEPTSKDASMYTDRQTATIYELRFHKRYFPHTLRMLKRLRDKWLNEKQPQQLIDELDLTIRYIRSPIISRQLQSIGRAVRCYFYPYDCGSQTPT